MASASALSTAAVYSTTNLAFSRRAQISSRNEYIDDHHAIDLKPRAAEIGLFPLNVPGHHQRPMVAPRLLIRICLQKEIPLARTVSGTRGPYLVRVVPQTGRPEGETIAWLNHRPRVSPRGFGRLVINSGAVAHRTVNVRSHWDEGATCHHRGGLRFSAARTASSMALRTKPGPSISPREFLACVKPRRSRMAEYGTWLVIQTGPCESL